MLTYDQIDSVFSAASEQYDKKISANRINLIIREIEVNTLLKYLKPGYEILEIGCGTAQEALKVMQKMDLCIDCIDVSMGMLRFARKKMIKNGKYDRFRELRINASEIDVIRKKYDLIYSFNGALNTEPQIDRFFSKISNSIKHGGYFIFSVRNRYCLSDFIYSISKFKWKRIKDRIRGYVDVPVGDGSVYSRYFSFAEIHSFLWKRLQLVEVIGLGNIVFPYIGEYFNDKQIGEALEYIEMAVSGHFPFNVFGDETLYVYRN